MNSGIFQVGLPIAIETFFKSYLTTHLVGWEPDVCLITGVVSSSGAAGKLKVNDHCKMRFLKDGIAYGFETKILAISFNPLPLMFSKYPKHIEKFAVRKFDRLKVNLPARLWDMREKNALDTTITDISAGGCGLHLPVKEGQSVSSDNIYKIAFNAMEIDVKLCCAIRKIRTGKDGQEIGIEFINVSPEEQEKIMLFLEACHKFINSRTDQILSKMKKTEKLFAGNLGEVSMMDLLQILDQLGKDGVIHITSGRQKGAISVKNGQILGASLEKMKGEDALVDLFSLKDGEFHVSAQDLPAGHMSSPINLALMEVCRLIDERTFLQEYIPTVEEKLQLTRHFETEDPEIKTIVGALQTGTSNIAQIHEITGLSITRSSLIAAMLIKDNYLKRSV